jgi:hypothetical protein
MTQAARKRGPHKGDGGRAAYKLHDDPDRWIIIAALWFRDDPKGQRAIETLQALDCLLTAHDSIELALGTTVRDGLEYGCLSITNTAPQRALSSNSNWMERRPLSAPGGRAFRRSRLQLLQRKVDSYRRAKFSEREAKFGSLAFLALDFLAGGRGDLAGPTLAMLGWDMAGPARERLAGILGAKGNR